MKYVIIYWERNEVTNVVECITLDFKHKYQAIRHYRKLICNRCYSAIRLCEVLCEEY